MQSYKWGAIASAVLAAILLVVAPRFITGSSGEEFRRAAVHAIPLTIFGSIQFLGWLGDAIFLGANKPSLRAVLILFEQAIRITLMLVLLERFQIYALLIAYFVAILARGIVAYFVADKFCFPQRFYFRQSAAAPVAAAVGYYLFLSVAANLIWQGDEITSIVLFFRGEMEIPFYRWESLTPGNLLPGPGVVVSKDTTIFLGTQDQAKVDAYTNLLISVGSP